MRRASRSTWLGLACTAALVTAAAPANAESKPPEPRCVCTSTVAPLAALESFDLIFFGRASVIGVSALGGADSEGEFVEFAVEGVWKGPVQRRLRVHTAEDDPLCAFSFTPGKSYLVFARLEDKAYSNRYRTSECARTAEASQALPDLAILGPPSDRLSN